MFKERDEIKAKLDMTELNLKRKILATHKRKLKKVILEIENAQNKLEKLENEYDEDKLMEDVLSLDILDFVTEDESYIIYTDSNKFIEVKDALTDMGYDKFIVSEVTFVPNNYMDLDEENTEKVVNLIDALNDLDDVQAVYHNLEI